VLGVVQGKGGTKGLRAGVPFLERGGVLGGVFLSPTPQPDLSITGDAAIEDTLITDGDGLSVMKSSRS